MSKLQEMLENRGKTFNQLSLAMAQISPGGNLYKLKKGTMYINECDFSTIDFICRFLECDYKDLMEPEELDGTVTYIKYLNNIKKRFVKNFEEIDDGIYAILKKKNRRYYLGWVTDNDKGESEIIMVRPNDDNTYTVFKASFIIDGHYRFLDINQYDSSEPLFDEDVDLEENPVLNLKQGYSNITKLMEEESGKPLTYLEFINEIGPLVRRDKW